jgi:hypothetical protein
LIWSVAFTVTTEVNPLTRKFIALLLIATMALTAFGAVGMTTKVGAAPQQTTTTLTASNTAPGVNEQVTFWARLTTTNGVALENMPITIYHYFNNIRYDDVVNKLTDSSGQVSIDVTFKSAGVRDYYATFAGGIDSTSAYDSSSGTIQVTVSTLPSTQIYVQAPTVVVPVNTPLTITARLDSYNQVGLPNKPVTIYHYFNGVRYDDVKNKLTDGNGKVAVSVTFGSTGVREYYASFAGDTNYGKSTSQKMTVDAGTATLISLSAVTTSPAANQQVTITATLFWVDPKTDSNMVLINKPVTIYHYFKGVRYDDVKNKLTDGNGKVAVSVTFGSTGVRDYYASFAGDASYCNSTSEKLLVNVGIPTSIWLGDSTTSPKVNEPVTFTGHLRITSAELLANKPVTIYHYFKGVRYDDVKNKLTDINGQVAVTVTFTSTGVRDYYATFAGDSQYASSDSSAWPVSVIVTT